MTNDNIPLFRGKTFEGDWVYGSHVYSFKDKQSYITEHDENELSYAVQNETVGQFTGFYDKDGAKIFEGDEIMSRNRTYFVNFANGQWKARRGIVNSELSSETQLGKIIGNLYEYSRQP